MTRTQNVNSVLNAKWSQTPFVLEAAEFLGDIKSDYFWAFLSFLAEDDIVNQEHLDEELYAKVVGFSSRYLCSEIVHFESVLV